MSSASSRGERVTVLGPQRHRLQADRLQRPRHPRVDGAGRREVAALHPAERRRRRRCPPNGALPVSRRRGSRPGCTRRWPGRAGRAARRPARGSCTPACPRPSPAASSPSRCPRAGRKRRLVRDGSGGASARPVTLARPQSTTSVSPYLPSMMLPGFRSRCSTPRLWAYVDRVAHVDEPAQQLVQRQGPLAGVAPRAFVGLVEPLDRLLEAVALDEPHGVEGPAVGVAGPGRRRGRSPGAPARR